ncbi:MAG: DEAD/DEAH box helicase [Candidatus Ranarchaeia archaeon]
MKPGDWIWDQETHQPAQIISIETLWGKKAIKAFHPTTNTVKYLNPEQTQPIKQNPIQTKQHLIYTLAAAKIINHQNSNQPLSPLQADIIPLPHQINTLEKTLNSNQIRYLLADEVGLGKTIEAGLIFRELKNQKLIDRTLIIAPRGLTKQWVDELKTRFNETFQLIIPNNITELQETNIWQQTNQIVTSLDSVKPLRRRTGWTQEKIDQYNENRYKNLVEANWDLVIIDEAHKLSGTTTGVARHRLGQALSKTAPYLLLLSATPHQGKTEQFKRLISLLDPEKIEQLETITQEQVKPYVIRTEKRTSINHEGKPLFTPRTTKLIPVKWGPKHNDQRRLYDEVTDYIRYGYNKAQEQKRSYIGFLMVLMQRLVSSSTHAIRQALEKRLQVLETGEAIYTEEEQDLFTDLEGQIKIDELFTKIGDSLRDEKKEVENLASLARRCENNNPDARAEALLELIYQQRTEENNPDLKFLIFTEFIPTQNMLTEFLENRGFKIVTINGSMDLPSRIEAQHQFADEAEILISTEAGGEGINLQFCHIVINYDLPWNPMRIEQRIGRVDRIGQKHPVKAFNLAFDNTVEYRIREVLEEKLQTILNEFGVDKLSDVLDADESEIDFNNIFRDAVIAPEKAAKDVENYIEKLRETLKERQTNQLIKGEKELTIEKTQEILNHPLHELTKKMTINYLQASNGEIQQEEQLYELTFPDGYSIKQARFHQQTSNKGNLVTINHPKIKEILQTIIPYVPEMQIPVIKVSNIPPQLIGYWSLWQVKAESNLSDAATIFPIFINEAGKFLKPTSNQLWDILLQDQTSIQVTSNTSIDPLNIYNQIREIALSEGKTKTQELEEQHMEKIKRIFNKKQMQHALTLYATTRIRSVKERTLKRETLEKEYEEWLNTYETEKETYYQLQSIALLRVEPIDA